MKTYLLSILLSLSFCGVFAQEGHHPAKVGQHHKEEAHYKNKIAITLGYTYVPDGFGVELPNIQFQNDIFVPTLGIDYFRRFADRWSVGVIADIELDQYFIKLPSLVNDLARENVVVLCLIASYEMLPGWDIYAGPGAELERNESFAVLKIGSEYEFIRGENWGIGPFFSYDFKGNGDDEYNAFEFGLSFNRFFGAKFQRKNAR
ncbi:hypothetical protein V6R21_12220 [Limibacter armeniacum]|uniref:hypothetical protein n=1 Tax=Limibacter armeniacum TaxID=466084 RepID=UPI002FE56ACD